MRWTFTIAICAFATAVASAQDMPLSQVLIEGQEWQIVQHPNGRGGVRLLQSAAKGQLVVLRERGRETIDPTVPAPKAPPDRGRAITPQQAFQSRFDTSDSREPYWRCFVVVADRFAYGISEDRRDLQIIRGNGPPFKIGRVQASGLNQPSCLLLNSARGTMFVADRGGKYVWAFRVDKSGELSAGQPYGSLRTKAREPSHSSALLTDTDDRLYVLTDLGVQILDPTGRLCGVLNNPTREPLVAMTFGGEQGDRLCVATKSTVYARQVKPHLLGSASAKGN